MTLLTVFISEQDRTNKKADVKLWGKVSMLRGCIAMQRGFKNPEGWTERKHIIFRKDKDGKVPCGSTNWGRTAWLIALQEGPGKGCRIQCCLHREHSQEDKGNMAPTQLLWGCV